MSYRYLSEQLRPTADTAARFFTGRWGVTKFKFEEPLNQEITYRPTLQAITSDHHYLCVEVSESPYPTGLDAFVLDCMRLCRPVRLFVALPSESKNQYYNRDLARARDCGVGVLEVSQGNPRIIQQPTSLSLAGVRPVDLEKSPKRYRLALSQAEDVFKGGNPAKGCSLLYDEIEDLSRKVAKKINLKGFWKPLPQNRSQPKINFDKDAWYKVIRVLMDNLDLQKCRYISHHLLARILGLTPYRNEASHKPRTKSALIKRDSQLRTRFENAVDILFDSIQAVKPLHI